jgi:hypothetical protein
VTRKERESLMALRELASQLHVDLRRFEHEHPFLNAAELALLADGFSWASRGLLGALNLFLERHKP